RTMMPGQPLNSAGVNDPKLTEMLRLQRRTFDEKKRRDLIFDIQRHAAHHAYYLYDASQKVVSAWEPYVKNYGPNNGFDYGGRLMAARVHRSAEGAGGPARAVTRPRKPRAPPDGSGGRGWTPPMGGRKGPPVGGRATSVRART